MTQFQSLAPLLLWLTNHPLFGRMVSRQVPGLNGRVFLPPTNLDPPTWRNSLTW